MITNSALEILRGNPELYKPLSATIANTAEDGSNASLPLRLNLRITGKTNAFEAVLIMSGILRDIELGVLKAKMKKEKGGANQILVVPYISKTIQNRLEEEGVSAIDLSGNYYIVTPELTAIRLDQQNRFKVKRTIQNIYSRNSSIAVRWLLTKKTVANNLLQLKSDMDQKGSELSLGTISKVLKVLDEDIYIVRTPMEIKVLKPDELLTRLKTEYRQPAVLSELRIRLPENKTEAGKILSETLGENSWIWSGSSSAERYATTLSQSTSTVYTKTNPEETRITGQSDNRFYNCTLQYITDTLVYFDAIKNFSSAIQSYIELSRMDKREREIAEDIRRVILNEQ